MTVRLTWSKVIICTDADVDGYQIRTLILTMIYSLIPTLIDKGFVYLVPIYIEVEDGERLARALERERRQAVPKYKEMCRRFLADEEDFCEENLKRLGIDKRYRNTDMETCLNEITGVMCNGKL